MSQNVTFCPIRQKMLCHWPPLHRARRPTRHVREEPGEEVGERRRMFAEPSGPDPAEWPAALIRGFHPLRWAVCLGGLAVTWVAAVLAQALYDRAIPRLADW